jgi:phage gp46-like protein
VRISRFQGDPAVKITANGADMVFMGGQPVMDQGLENAVLISLFTLPGFWGNSILPVAQQIGSEYQQPRTVIDIETIDDINRSAEDALEWMLDTGIASSVDVETVNPTGQITTRIKIAPPGENLQEFIFTQNGQNWISQAVNPAHALTE